MIGYTSSEGYFFEYKIRNISKSNSNTPLIENFEHMIPHHLNIPHDTPLSRYIANEIKSFYFNDEEPTLTKHKTAFYEVLSCCYIFFKY